MRWDYCCVSSNMSLPPALSGGERLERSWAEVGAPTQLTVWRHIRALRHRPPGRASSGERKQIFGSALEQAEQLFAAAESVGYASRPILLFYGLSQAGRAIAAASTSADEDHFKLSGHGIRARDLDSEDLHKVTIVDNGLGKDKDKGSFVQLAPLLRSGTLPQGTPLGQVWTIIPDLRERPLDTRYSDYLPIFSYKNQVVSSRLVTGIVSGLPYRFAEMATVEEIDAFLEHYPTLAGSSASPLVAETVTRDARAGSVSVYREWPRPADRLGLFPITGRENSMSDWQIIEDRLTQPYRGDSERFIFPAIGGANRPLHPLLAWWALLFTLSMLARYEPASWTSHLARDESANAVPIEAALDGGLHTCPELIAHAIHAVTVRN
jgi:hypothetical protein